MQDIFHPQYVDELQFFWWNINMFCDGRGNPNGLRIGTIDTPPAPNRSQPQLWPLTLTRRNLTLETSWLMLVICHLNSELSLTLKTVTGPGKVLVDTLNPGLLCPPGLQQCVRIIYIYREIVCRHLIVARASQIVAWRLYIYICTRGQVHIDVANQWFP